jgi:hypothetical protein
MDDELNETWRSMARRDDAHATYTALPQPPLALRARNLLDERYQGLATRLDLSPYELWVLAESLVLAMEHPGFQQVGAGTSDVSDIARRMWAACHNRLAALDWVLAEAMPRPR